MNDYISDCIFISCRFVLGFGENIGIKNQIKSKYFSFFFYKHNFLKVNSIQFVKSNIMKLK